MIVKNFRFLSFCLLLSVFVVFNSLLVLGVTNINDTSVTSGNAYFNFYNFTGDTWCVFDGSSISFNESRANDTFIQSSGDVMSGNLTFQDSSINNVDSIIFNISADITPSVGSLSWNTDESTIQSPIGVGNVVRQYGAELVRIRKNGAGVPIVNGQLVYSRIAQGERIIVDLADANASVNKIDNVGMVTSETSCNDNADCAITYFGDVRGLDLSAYAPGTPLYLECDGSGTYTDVKQTGNCFNVHIGRVKSNSSTNGIIDFNVEYLDISDNPATMNLNVLNNLSVGDRIDFNNVSLKQLSANSDIDGGVLGIMQTNPPGGELPHFWLQSGGSSQASGVARSFMIVDEYASLLNSTNRTSCVAWSDYYGVALQIDCNTTTTGADLYVGDDVQINGDVWMRDDQNEFKNLRGILTSIDNFQKNIILGKLSWSVNSTFFNLTNDDLGSENRIRVNLDGERTFLNTSLTTDLNTGTNDSPVSNYLSIYNKSGVVGLHNDVSDLSNSINHADVATIVIGNVGNIYVSHISPFNDYEFMTNTYEISKNKFKEYISDLAISASSNELNVSSGSDWANLRKHITSNNMSSSTNGFYWVRNDGSFVQCTTFDNTCFNQYNDGTTLSGNYYINLIVGIVADSENTSRLVVIPQDTPDSTYTTISSALADEDAAISYTSNNPIVSRHTLRLARIIVNENGVLQQVFGNNYYKGIIGTPTADGAAGGTNDHSLLTNLDFASSGHTGFASSSQITALNTSKLSSADIDTFSELDSLVADAVLLKSGGTLTSAKWCLWDGSGIDCNVEPVTGFTYSSYFNQNLNTTDAVTFATLDTGQGANELYPMDQGVTTTSNVQFNNVTSVNCITFDSGGSICSS